MVDGVGLARGMQERTSKFGFDMMSKPNKLIYSFQLIQLPEFISLLVDKSSLSE